MVLYQAITGYHLMSAIIHKLKNHSNEECVILLAETLIQKYPNHEELSVFFEKVIIFNINAGVLFDKPVYPEQVTDCINEIFQKNKIKIEDFDEINVWAAHYNLGIYLEHEKIPFSYWEDASGMITRNDVLAEIVNNQNNPQKAAYCENVGLFDGSCECISKRVFDFNAQCKEFSTQNAVDFCVTREFISLSENDQIQIRKFFKSDFTIDVTNDYTLFLTQHFANLKILSFDEQILIYQLVMDYFFENKNVVFKTHPDDLLYYSQLFEGSTVIRRRFPSEFLPVMFSNKPTTIATISSTAINNLRSYFEDSFELGYKFEKDFRAIHRYYIALRLYEIFGENMRVETIGADDRLITELMKTGEITENHGGICCIVDDISTQEEYDREQIIGLIESLPDDSAVMFINSKQDYCFYDIEHKALWNNIVPICINKERIREDEFHDDLQAEVIYLFSKNERVLEMGRSFAEEKTLKNTGEKISVMQLTPDQERIKVLEGILEATETRLLYYMDLLEAKGDESK